MTRLRFTLAAVGLVLLAGGGGPGVLAQEENDTSLVSGEAERTELQNIRNQIASQKTTLTTLEKKEGTLSAQLAHLEEKLRLSDQLIQRLKSRLVRLNRQMKTTDVGLSLTEGQLAAQQVALAELLSAFYYQSREYSPSVGLLFIPPEQALLEAEVRASTVRLARALRQQVQTVASQRGELSQNRSLLEARQKELLSLKRETERTERQRREDLEKKGQLLAEIRAQKQETASQVAELEKSAEALEKILAKIEKRRRARPKPEARPGWQLPAGEFARHKGSLPWPVAGEVVSTFGPRRDPVKKTVSHQPGIDIAAGPGAAVQAVATGVVAYVGFLRGYDRFVIVEHDAGYYTLYAHLDGVQVAEGQVVQNGQTIGSVASEKNDALLHFEIRQGKQQLNPQEWLQ